METTDAVDTLTELSATSASVTVKRGHKRKRPDTSSINYDETDICRCLSAMQTDNLTPEAASEAYPTSSGFCIPASTLRSRFKRLRGSSSLTDGTFVPTHGSPILSWDQDNFFADWIRDHALADSCLTMEVLNAKVMQLAAASGHPLKQPPSKDFWSRFFQRVCLVGFFCHRSHLSHSASCMLSFFFFMFFLLFLFDV